MKYKSIPFMTKACVSMPILAIGSLLLSPLTLAITPEEALSEYIWQGFQGGPEHKGHIPVSLIVDNTPTAVANWPMKALLSNPINTTSAYSVYHAQGTDISAFPTFQIHQMLHQPTVVDDAVIISNRGLATPFVITHIDRITNTISSFDYLHDELGDPDELFIPDTYCTQSQSQVVFEDDVAYFSTNYFESDSSNIRLCDPDSDVPKEQITHLRAQPIRPDKRVAGGQALELVGGGNTILAMPAHHKDQFLSPTIRDGVIFAQGGGLSSTRDHTGIFSYQNIGTSAVVEIQNNFASLNDDGYIKVAPNSLWAPAVSSKKALVFLNGTTSDDYRDNIPTLTEVNLSTNAVTTQQIDSISFAPTQDTAFNVFNMATAPVLADDNTLVVVNNGNLIFFDVSTNEFISAPTLINGNFYGQPVVANDVVYVLSTELASCGGFASCIRAISATSKASLKDVGGDNWIWTPPGAGEKLNPTFVATNSHIFISSDSDVTYGVKTAKTTLNANRLEMTYPLGGQLAFAYDTLFIAHSAADGSPTSFWSDLVYTRPYISSGNVTTLNTALATAWASHDGNISTFTDAVKSNNASVVVALDFALDGTQVADLDVDLTITDPAGATEIELDQIMTYQAVVTNRGALDATNVVATAIIPGAVALQSTFTGPVSCSTSGSLLTCNIDGDVSNTNSNTLASGDSATFTFQVIPKVESQINLTVNVDGTELNPDIEGIDTDDNSSTTSITSIPASPSSHNLSLVITANAPYIVDLDRNITYTMTVANAAGSDTALDVRLSYAVADSAVERIISSGNCTSTNCTIDRLNAGDSKVFTIQTNGIGPGQGGLTGSVASTREEATDTDLTNNSSSFNLTNVSSTQSAEVADELPRAGGSLNWLYLLGSLALLLRRKKQ